MSRTPCRRAFGWHGDREAPYASHRADASSGVLRVSAPGVSGVFAESELERVVPHLAVDVACGLGDVSGEHLMLPAWQLEISTQDPPRRLWKVTEEDLFLGQIQAKTSECGRFAIDQDRAAKLIGALHGHAVIADL